MTQPSQTGAQGGAGQTSQGSQAQSGQGAGGSNAQPSGGQVNAAPPERVADKTHEQLWGTPAESQSRVYLQHSTMVERTMSDGSKVEVLTDAPRDGDLPLGAVQKEITRSAIGRGGEFSSQPLQRTEEYVSPWPGSQG